MRDFLTVLAELTRAINDNNDMTPGLQMRLNRITDNYPWYPPELLPWDALREALKISFPDIHPRMLLYRSIFTAPASAPTGTTSE